MERAETKFWNWFKNFWISVWEGLKKLFLIIKQNFTFKWVLLFLVVLFGISIFKAMFASYQYSAIVYRGNESTLYATVTYLFKPIRYSGIPFYMNYKVFDVDGIFSFNSTVVPFPNAPFLLVFSFIVSLLAPVGLFILAIFFGQEKWFKYIIYGTIALFVALGIIFFFGNELRFASLKQAWDGYVYKDFDNIVLKVEKFGYIKNGFSANVFRCLLCALAITATLFVPDKNVIEWVGEKIFSAVKKAADKAEGRPTKTYQEKIVDVKSKPSKKSK